MKIVSITDSEFDKFSLNHKYHSYYQTSAYAKVMSNFGLSSLYLGFYDNDNLVGATMILSKIVMFGFKYGYAPRGMLIDYDNYSQVLELTKDLKAYLLKEKYIFLKIDPLIVINKYDKKGNKLYTNPNLDNILTTMKDTGFFHCGYNNLFESIKPRWNSYLNLEDNITNIYNHFDKQVRNKIRKALKYGVTAYKDNSKIDDIYPFIEKDNTYSINYYYQLRKEFKDNIEVYVAKLNTEDFVNGSRSLYEKELEYNDYLNNIISRNSYKGKNIHEIINKKMESDKILVTYKNYMVNASDLLKDYPDGLIIGGAIVIKDNDTVHLLIDGFNQNYSKLCPLFLLRWQIIKDYCNEKYKLLGMNAISGIFDKKNNPYWGLNEVKFSYNTTGYEYIGEFNLITNSAMYALYKNIQAKDSFKDIKK